MVAEVHLGEDLGVVQLDPLQRGLPDAVLPRGDHHQVAGQAQALQAGKCTCRPRPGQSEADGAQLCCAKAAGLHDPDC